MPTSETLPRFTADLQHLTPAQRRRFHRVVMNAFVPDLRTGRRFRPGLRIKGVSCSPGVYELTWSMATGLVGRATFEYGTEAWHCSRVSTAAVHHLGRQADSA